MLGGKAFGALRDEIHMRALAEDFAGGTNRIPDMLHAAQAAGAYRSPVHDESIELNLAFTVEEAAAARIESIVIFHDDHGFLNCVGRGTAVT